MTLVALYRPVRLRRDRFGPWATSWDVLASHKRQERVRNARSDVGYGRGRSDILGPDSLSAGPDDR